MSRPLLPHAIVGEMKPHHLYEVVPDYVGPDGVTYRCTINWGDQRPMWVQQREFMWDCARSAAEMLRTG